jgi:CheY-like chemotaxis protein
MSNTKPILLVEDDSVDAITVKRAFNDLGITKSLIHLIDGEDALGYLENEVNEKPSFVLLDLNMPKMNGIELLRAMKINSNLRSIPVVVLTTSREDRDVIDSFDLSVAGYVVKPIDYTQFVETIKTINMYWSLSQLPVKG